MYKYSYLLTYLLTGCDSTLVASAAACAVATHAHEEMHCREAWQQHLEHVADVLLPP